MLTSYFIHIAAVRMAAALSGFKLYDNYAFHGALTRFARIDLGEIQAADGIPDVPEKAKSFRFGQMCGEVLARRLDGLDGAELTLREAAVAKGVFMKLTSLALAKYQPDELKKNIKTIFRALLKHAQIKTHTAKPGGEDINAWLASYNNLLSGYEPYLDALTDLLTGSDEALAKKMDAFFNRSDALTALAIRSGEPGTDAPEEGELAEALSAEPSSAFGRILREIITPLCRN